jgi:hypothetical protein
MIPIRLSWGHIQEAETSFSETTFIAWTIVDTVIDVLTLLDIYFRMFKFAQFYGNVLIDTPEEAKAAYLHGPFFLDLIASFPVGKRVGFTFFLTFSIGIILIMTLTCCLLTFMHRPTMSLVKPPSSVTRREITARTISTF